MSIFNAIIKRYKRMTAKQFILAGVFMLALAGALGGGFAARQNSHVDAASCYDINSIDRQNLNGGCGAQTIKELCDDIVDHNDPRDLLKIYTDSKIGLPADQCSKLGTNQAHVVRDGYVDRGGEVWVDGEIVWEDAWTMGRTDMGGKQRTPIYVSGSNTKYYHSHPSVSFKSTTTKISAVVMFNQDGVAEFGFLKPCGNPITVGHKRTPEFECKTLNKHQVTGQDDTYTFTTSVHTDQYNLAKVTKLEYYVDYNDGKGRQLFSTQTNPSTATAPKKLDKTATVSVDVTFKLPGNQYRTVKAANLCKMIIEVKKKVFHVCKDLIATPFNNESFRFTVLTDQTPNAGITVKNASLQVDGNAATVVTTKDNGNISTIIPFDDYNEHTVRVTQIVFTVDGKDVTVQTPEGKCIEKVKRVKKFFYECKDLDSDVVDANTFRFTVLTNKSPEVAVKNASLKVDGNAATVVTTKQNGNISTTFDFNDYDEHTVKVTQIVFTVDGNDVAVNTPEGKCIEKVKRVKKFFHKCEDLKSTVVDANTFRFTVKTFKSPEVTVKNASLKVDGDPATVVTAKDNDGNISTTFDFNDYNEHTVKVTQIVFTVDGNDVTVQNPEGKCVEKVKREKKVFHKCEDLKSSIVDANTFRFTVHTAKSQDVTVKNASIKVDDNAATVVTTKDNDGNISTTVDFDDYNEHTIKVTQIVFTVDGADVTVNTPDGKCVEKVKREKKFFYECKDLKVGTTDNMTFRFTVLTKQSADVTVKNASIKVDSNNAEVVTAKDSDGNIYKDFTFTDEDWHLVQATAYFDTPDGVKSDSGFHCKAKVKAKQPPKCAIPGYEDLPKDDPRCAPCEYNSDLPKGDAKCMPPCTYNPELPKDDPKCKPPKKECKPGIPEGDYRCTQEECKPGVAKGDAECEPLVNTGPGSVAGLFAGITAAGAVGHRLVSNYRGRRGQ